MTSALARMLCTVQRANLQLLFFISVATTAPRCETSLVRQSRAPPLPWALLSNSLRAWTVTNWSSPLMAFFCTASSSVRTTRYVGCSSLVDRSKRRYL